MRHSQRPGTGVTHHDDFRIAGQFRDPGRNLIHGHMYDARNARKLQFPRFADVDDLQRIATIATRLEFRSRDFTHHGIDPVRSEREGLGPCGVIQGVDTGFEQSIAVPGGLAGTRHQQGLLQLSGSDHDKKFSTDG